MKIPNKDVGTVKLTMIKYLYNEIKIIKKKVSKIILVLALNMHFEQLNGPNDLKQINHCNFALISSIALT